MNLLKVPEVAERLSCSESLVYQMVASGELPHYRLGKGRGSIRVSEEQILALLANRQQGGGPTPAAPKRRVTPPFRHLKL